MADTSQVNNSWIQLEPQSLQEGTHLVIPSKHGKTSKSSLSPIREAILRHEEESKDSLQAEKPMIHLLGGSYALNLNLGKLNRKIAKKEENERRKLNVRRQ